MTPDFFIHTLCREPRRVVEWVRIAREEAERVG